MIVFSRDAVADIERLRSFLDWAAIERLQDFPNRGLSTGDTDIRQVVLRFGSSGYIVRYAVLPDTKDIIITRIWHGREDRP